MKTNNVFARGFKSWCENVAIQQRRELKLKTTEPLDPQLLAKHLRINVWTAEQVPGFDPVCLKVLTEDDPNSWSAITICTGTSDLIVVNPTHQGGRRASDIMHEISHIIIGHEPARVDITEDGLLILNMYDKKQEEEAKWLSGCLLLPRDVLLLIRRERLNKEVAAARFGVSVPMLTFRLNMTKLGSQFSMSRTNTIH